MRLGVNVDHAATLRQARGTAYPDPVVCAMLCEYGGCDSIVMHLREDRRHIKERDLILAKQALKLPLNLEMSTDRGVVAFALKLKPDQATLVPEKRRELTTEGGLDLVKHYRKVKRVAGLLQDAGITVSLFIDPSRRQLTFAKKIGADNIEIHSGKYCDAKTVLARRRQLQKIKQAAALAKKMGFFVACGHGLDYENVKDIVKIKAIEELNIGHSVVCRSLFVGMTAAVEGMLDLMKGSR